MNMPLRLTIGATAAAAAALVMTSLNSLSEQVSENQQAFEDAGGVRVEQGEIVESYRRGPYDIHYYENDVARYCGPYGLSGRVDLQHGTFLRTNNLVAGTEKPAMRGVIREDTFGVIRHIANKDHNLIPVDGEIQACPVDCRLETCVPGTNIPTAG